MCNLLWVAAIFPQVLSQPRELRCSFLCDAFNRYLWLELFGIEENCREDIDALRFEQVIERKSKCPCREVGVIGADNDIVYV